MSDTPDTLWLIAATALAIASPMYWFTAARPLSDIMGVAAAVAVQALTLSAATQRGLMVASFCAALAAGIRSQVVWLTVPLLVLQAARLFTKPRPVTNPSHSSSVAGIWKACVAYLAGILVWGVPLVALSGGPARYWRALFSQGAEDFTGVRMLWTTPNVRTLVDALYYALVAPWAAWPIAGVVLVLATCGAVALLWRDRRALLVLAVAYGPYFVFDVVFQESITSRYALPLVIPMAFLAATGARLLPKQSGLAVVVLLAAFCAHIAGTSVAAFARQKAPAFRLLDDMREAAASMPAAPVLAMDRREEFDLRRPIRWIGDALPRIERTLPSPPQHEWLELVKYWNEGGRAPVWFVADPLRTDIDLVEHQHGSANSYRWQLPYPILLSGIRPNQMDWYRLLRPEWYIGQGWALTPEAAGVSENDRRGLTTSAIDAWLGREVLGGAMFIGGRNFEPANHTVFVELEGAAHDEWVVAPGFFLRLIPLPRIGASGGRDYVKLTVRTSPLGRVALEQFDASSSRPIFGFADGWHEPEYNPQTGLRWRWLSEKGELKVRSPVPAVRLHLEGESPLKYFPRGSRLAVRAAGRTLFDDTLSADFSLDIAIPGVTDAVTLETDQVFIPAEHGWRRSGDRRHLGLRIFKCELRAAR